MPHTVTSLMQCRAAGMLLLCWLLLVLSPSSAAQEAPQASRFGIIEGMWFPELTCDLNPGWERLIFDWSQHQPDGPNSWTGFLQIPDEWLRAASHCNREIVAVIKNTPAWATDGTPGIGVPRGLHLPVDDPGNVWANFIRMAAAYYTSRGVYRFIIWNEPDIQPGVYGYEFEGTLEDYARLVKVAHLAARQGNPAAMIHLAGTTYWHDANSGQRLYTDRLLEYLRADPEGAAHNYFFEALSLHIYFRTDTVYDLARLYRDLLDQHGFTDKVIWITETNASPNLDPDWPVIRPQFQVTLAQQASFLVQSAALALAAGVQRVAAYKLYDQQLPPGGESFGLLSPNHPTIPPRPAFYAWQTVIDHFSDATTAALSRTDEANVVLLEKANGQRMIVAWARTEQPVTLILTTGDHKAVSIAENGTRTLLRSENDEIQLTLPGAHCDETDGCAIGGRVLMVVLPDQRSLPVGRFGVQLMAGNTPIELQFD